MKKIQVDFESCETVFYEDFLPRVMGDGADMRLTDAIVRSFVIYKSAFDKRRTVCRNVAVSKFLPAESVSLSTGVSLYDCRRVLRDIGESIDVTPIHHGYFPLLVGLESSIEKGVDTKMPTKLKGLSMVVYSYLVHMRDSGKKKGATVKAPVIDKWIDTMASDMNVTKPSLSRQIWKLESMGWIHRFYDGWGKPYLWISDTPMPEVEYESLIRARFGKKKQAESGEISD